VTPPRLIDIAPAFAEELETLLLTSGDGDLAAQVRTLALVDRCPCRQSNCSTFDSEPRPNGPNGRDDGTLVLDAEKGWVALDVVARRIVCVEVLDRPDVFDALLAIKAARDV